MKVIIKNRLFVRSIVGIIDFDNVASGIFNKQLSVLRVVCFRSPLYPMECV